MPDGRGTACMLGGRAFATKAAALREHAAVIRRWWKGRPQSEPLTGIDEQFARDVLRNARRARALADAGAPITIRMFRYRPHLPMRPVFWIGGADGTFAGRRYIHPDAQEWTDAKRRSRLRLALAGSASTHYRTPPSARRCADCGAQAEELDHVDPPFVDIAQAFVEAHDVGCEESAGRGVALLQEDVDRWVAHHDAMARRTDPVCSPCHRTRTERRRKEPAVSNTGHKRHQRRTIYTGAGTVRGGVRANHDGPAGHLDPRGRGIGCGRCGRCGSFFVLVRGDAERRSCYGCAPAGGAGAREADEDYTARLIARRKPKTPPARKERRLGNEHS